MRFSILIPSWNNLPYLRLCVESIRRNSTYDHQILVHVNGGGTDGTLEWVRSEGLEHTFSPDNIGVCWALNLLRTKVRTDYICFVNDDMYMLPGWDEALAE
ncbi:MAG: glycosyltransferase family 2 protein, partial [Bacteroidaceae bacterium]|nr:glycosyltransferase family 2 protein [Bacteroidaceae bacterium]